MNKLFTRIGVAFAGMAMAIGVGVVVGQGSRVVERVDAASDFEHVDWVGNADAVGIDYSKKYFLGHNDTTFMKPVAVSSGKIAVDTSGYGILSFEPANSDISGSSGYYYMLIKSTNGTSGYYVGYGSSSSLATTEWSANSEAPVNNKYVWKAVKNGNNGGYYFSNLNTATRFIGYNGSDSAKAYSTSNISTNTPLELYLKKQTITASSTNVFVNGQSTLTTNATSATWSVVDGGTGEVSLSATTGSSITVTGVSVGTVTIKAVADAHTVKTVDITIRTNTPFIELESLTDSGTTTGFTGEDFLVTANYGNLTGNFSWSVSGDATISDKVETSTAISGTLTGAGSLIITGSDEATPTPHSSSITITVSLSRVTSVVLSTSVLDLVVGKTSSISATVTVEGTASDTVTWGTENSSVATVSPLSADNGDSVTVTAVAAGTTNITATSGGVTVKCAVTVREIISNGTRYILTGYKSSDSSYYSMTGVSSNLGTATKKNNFYNATYSFVAVAGTGTYAGKWALQVGDGQFIRYNADKKIDVGAADSSKAYWTVSEGENGAVEFKNVNAATYYLQFNASSPRFTVYTGTQTDPFLVPVTDHVLVGSFIETKMHLHDYDSTLHVGEPGSGWCKDNDHNYYDKNGNTGAKYAFNNLSSSQRAMFMNVEYTEFATARARLVAWAAANSETIGTDAQENTNVLVSGANTMMFALPEENKSVFVFVAVIAAVSTLAIGGFFFLRKRKIG